MVNVYRIPAAAPPAAIAARRNVVDAQEAAEPSLARGVENPHVAPHEDLLEPLRDPWIFGLLAVFAALMLAIVLYAVSH